MVYGTQITIVNGVYKPTNITGGPHIVCEFLEFSQDDTGFSLPKWVRTFAVAAKGPNQCQPWRQNPPLQRLESEPLEPRPDQCRDRPGRMLRVAALRMLHREHLWEVREENSNETGAK